MEEGTEMHLKHGLRRAFFAILAPAVVAAFATLPMTAAAQDYDRYPARIDTVVPLEPHGTVDLSLISGRMHVTAWERAEVKVVASIEEGDGRLRFNASRSKVSLDIESGDGRRRRGNNGGDARYEVTVPRGSRLVLEAVSGDIVAAGVGGEVEANSVSGDVTVSDATSEVDVESVSGSVRASAITGTLRAHSVSGNVSVENAAGNVEAETVSGRILLDGIKSRSVRTESVNGNMTYTGSVDPSGRYTFEAHSGTIRLNLPDNVGAVFSVETFSGDIDSDFPVTMQPGQGRNREGRFEFTVGDGKARISAETFSGKIIINRVSDANVRRND
jgi:DUF4097 and DUF4098 domain-containing protein YvlB